MTGPGHRTATKKACVSVIRALPVLTVVSGVRTAARVTSATRLDSAPWGVLLGDTGRSVMGGAAIVWMNPVTLQQVILQRTRTCLPCQ